MNKLTEGDIFIVYCSELKYATFSRSGSFILNNINRLSEYDFPLTTFMCMYLGNNICEEYYSGIKMQINYPIVENGEYDVSIYAKYSNYKAFTNEQEKMNKFNELNQYIKSYPLIIEPISINDISQYVVCEYNNSDNTKKVITKLNAMAEAVYLESVDEYNRKVADEEHVKKMILTFKERFQKGE